jgi:quercetin dioxygenase-like cupin family protein
MADTTGIEGVRWAIDAYDDWVQAEKLPVGTGIAVDLMALETVPWPRMGANGALVHLDARGDFLNMYVLDIPPGKETRRIRHLYEAVVNVLDGSGATTVELPNGQKRTFEWRRGSMFALPVNAPYTLYNASGTTRARLAFRTNMPLLIKLFRNDRFVFDLPFDFSERFGDDRYLRGEGRFIPVREHRHQWETNFVPDLINFDQLRISNGRGRGSTNIMFVLADGTMGAHVSGIPAGNYKKAHRHSEGFQILQLSGEGYSLYWNERDYAAAGETPRRIDWVYGLAHCPPRGMWHQHFNVADEEARYSAGNFGSMRYPFFRERIEMGKRLSDKPNEDQIEYEDENPGIRTLFDAEVAKYRARAGTVTASAR